MADIWDAVAEQMLNEQASLSQDKPIDIWDQVAADMEPQPQRVPEVSLRGPAPIVTDFPQEGQQAQPIPEVSLPPIQRAPTAFPPIQMPQAPPPTPEPLAPMQPPAMLPPEAAPYRPSYDYRDMPDIRPMPQGPPVVEPPYEAPPVPPPPSIAERIDVVPDAFAQTLQQEVGPIVSGAAGMAAMRYGGVPGGRPRQPMPGETYTSAMRAVQRDPLVQEAKALSARAETDIPVPPWAEQTLPVQLSRGAARFMPAVGAGLIPGVGPMLAPAVIRLQAAGDEMEHGYKSRIALGMSEEDAARETFNDADNKGFSAQLIWTVAPGPMKKAADKFLIDKVGKGVAKRFIAGRVAAATEGYGLGYSSQVAQNIATGRPLTEGTHEAGKGLGVANLLMPRGLTAKEVAARRAPLPAEARQAVSGAVIRPTRRPTPEHQRAKERAKETSARAGHDIAKSNYERVLTNKSSRETNGARFRENVPKAFQSKSDVQQIKNGIIHMRDNLLKAARAALKEPWAKPASKQYEGYNKYAHKLSDDFDGRWKPETVMVTESAESPNTSPDNSFEATRRLMKMLSQNSEDVFDERMENWARSRTSKNKAGVMVPLYTASHVDFLKGKKFSEIPAGLELQAKWLRAFDEVYHPDKTLRVVRPDGTLGDTVKTSTGADMPFTWTPFKMIQNGVDALLEQRPVEEILHSPKVANYYMSKLLAFERSNHVVADTHHTSAAWGNSLPADHELVSAVFPAGRDIKKGEFAGYYSIVHEATLQAAKKLGMDPKEFQALVWSYQRGFKSPDVLGPGLAEVIQGLWKNAAQGRITGREAYDGTTEIANNFHGGIVPAPDYFGGRFRSADAPPPGTSGKPAELPQGGGVPGSAIRGGGILNASRVAEDLRVARTFFSSNTGNLTLDQAQAALHSKEHAIARLIDDDVNSQLGLGGSSRSGIGVWSDGAEDSIMHLGTNAESFDQVRYAAAIKAQLTGQKSALAFLTDPAGEDAVRSFVVPGKDIAKIHADLMNAGIEHKTMLPEGGDTRIFVLDQGKELSDKLGEIAQKYGITDGRTETGKGEFVGSGETFPESSKQFDAIRSDYEDRFPLARHYKERPGDYYSGRDTSTGKTLSERAARLQPKSEAGSVGGRGGEEAPLPEEQKPRAFGVRLVKDERLLEELRNNIGNRDYTPVPNKLTAAQAAELVNQRPITDVMNAIKDESNGLQFHIRSTMGQIVIQRLNETAARLKAVGDTQGANQVRWQGIDMSEYAMELGTRMGQGVQSFAMWNRLDPQGKLMSVMRVVKKTRNDFTKRNGEDVDKIVEGVNEGSKPEQSKIDQMVARQQDKIARSLSDTPTWASANPVKKNEILELIRAHLKERQEQFVERMDQYGVSRPLTESIDRMATENRRRIDAINNTKEARARAKMFDDAADRIAQQLSDTPTFRSRGQPDLAKLLIKEHLKKPQPDFVKRLVELGADRDTAHTIDRLAIENRSRILTVDRAKRAAELRKQHEPRNKVAKKLQKADWEKLVELADHGLLTDRSFMDTAAERLGLPRVTPKVQEQILELAGKIRDAPEGMPKDFAKADLARYLKSVMGYKFTDIPTGVYYSNMLAGYNTHLVNLVDTAFNVIGEVNNLALANPKSATRVWANTLKGFGEGISDFWVALSMGKQLSNTKWLDVPDIMEVARFGVKGGVPPIAPGTMHGRVMHWLAESKAAYPLRATKYVARLMGASDALMYRTAKEAKAALIADRVGREEGLRGKELDMRVQELLGRSSDLTAAYHDQATSEGYTGAARRVRVSELRSQARGIDANADAEAFAGAATYNQKPRGMLGYFSAQVDKTFAPFPLARATIIPFTHIVANVTNMKLDYFPVVGHLRAIRGYYGDEGTPNADERSALMMRANMGTMALAGLGAAQYAGLVQIHGGGPSDTNKRKQKIETGWRPYTLEVNGKFYSYMYTPPGLAIASLGNVLDTDRYDELKKKDALIRAAYVMSRVPNTVFNQTFLSSLSNVFDAMSVTDPERSIFAWKKFVSSTVGSATTPRLALDVQRIFDPKMYDADTIQGVLLKNTPFASFAGRPVLNAFGEPIKPPSNRFISVGTKDMAWQTILKADLVVPMPSKSTVMPDGRGGKRDITPAEYYELVQKSGPAIRQWVIDNSVDLIEAHKTSKDFGEAAQKALSNAAEGARKQVLMDLYNRAFDHPVAR